MKAMILFLATGRTETVRRFVELAFAELDREIVWQGEGVEEVGKDAKTGDVLVEIEIPPISVPPKLTC